MVYMNELRGRNKKLMMELSLLDLKTADGRKRKEEIAAEMKGNNQDMQAFATALGGNEDYPRLIKYKGNNG